MNRKQKRQIAIGAARSQLRRLGSEMTIEAAEQVLDEMASTEPHLVASEWYNSATSNEWKLFRREWKWMRN